MHGLQQEVWTLMLKKLVFEDAYHLACASRDLRAFDQSESVWLTLRYVASKQQQLGFVLRVDPLLEHLELTLKSLKASSLSYLISRLGEACPAKGVPPPPAAAGRHLVTKQGAPARAAGAQPVPEPLTPHA